MPDNGNRRCSGTFNTLDVIMCDGRYSFGKLYSVPIGLGSKSGRTDPHSRTIAKTVIGLGVFAEHPAIEHPAKTAVRIAAADFLQVFNGQVGQQITVVGVIVC